MPFTRVLLVLAPLRPLHVAGPDICASNCTRPSMCSQSPVMFTRRSLPEARYTDRERTFLVCRRSWIRTVANRPRTPIQPSLIRCFPEAPVAGVASVAVPVWNAWRLAFCCASPNRPAHAFHSTYRSVTPQTLAMVCHSARKGCPFVAEGLNSARRWKPPNVGELYETRSTGRAAVWPPGLADASSASAAVLM